jgi:SAM-dependent methyltransferase
LCRGQPDPPVTAEPLALTGERTMPGVASENYWFRRHEAAYRHLCHEVSPGLMVEIGAGEGYGAAMLAAAGTSVIALDYDSSSIGHLARQYRALFAVQGNLAAVPIGSHVADAVSSLQVIEHVWDHPQFIAECARVLKPAGLLLLTTPNRLTFSPDSPNQDRPANPFHTHEFTVSELSRLVVEGPFDVTAVRGLDAGARLTELDEKYAAQGATFVSAQLASRPDKWPPELVADVASVSVEDFVVSEQASEHCLDLILLARRR